VANTRSAVLAQRCVVGNWGFDAQPNLSPVVWVKKSYLRVAGAVVDVCESDGVVMSLRAGAVGVRG
jgi:hypothetical protein